MPTWPRPKESNDEHDRHDMCKESARRGRSHPHEGRSCALPYLVVAGIVTGAGAAALQQTLVAGAIALGGLALGMWWLRRRQLAKRVTAAGGSGCGDSNCVC